MKSGSESKIKCNKFQQLLTEILKIQESQFDEIMDRYEQLDKDSRGQIMKSELGI